VDVTAREEEAESLVDGLSRYFDDQFAELEREYSQARQDMAQFSPKSVKTTPVPIRPSDAMTSTVDDQDADLERELKHAPQDMAQSGLERFDTSNNALEARNERFELLRQVATLQTDVSRQSDELDERDRLLNELGDKIVGFEMEIAQHHSVSAALHTARQQTLDQHSERSRLAALLDTSMAEHQELVAVTNRLQNDRDHLQELLTKATSHFKEVEAQLVQGDDKVRRLEAARDPAAHEHDLRANELIEARSEMSKLSNRIGEMVRAVADADQRAEKSEALAERRSNEARYLNRCIGALNDKLDAAGAFETDATSLRRDLTLAERHVADLERDLATQQSEAAAASVAPETRAKHISDFEESIAHNEQLQQARDDERKALSARLQGTTVERQMDPEQRPAVASLAERARELSARRSNEAAQVVEAGEQASASARVDADLGDKSENEPASLPEAKRTAEQPVTELPALATVAIPAFEFKASDSEPGASEAGVAAVPPEPTDDISFISLDHREETASAHAVPSIGFDMLATRKRTVLPLALEPNTPEAVAYLLMQPGVTVIVDARGTCGRTGIQPSELFARIALVRDHFDVPVEVVVTPASTPVGGAPDLPAIGVHYVSGADTVADRIRALCMGLPADQPLVVIAGTDQVWRAASGQDANVVEPAVILNLVVG
jgi:chromosome segregation ATPase